MILRIFFFILLSSYALASGKRIEVLTIYPGAELYSLFGHTAIRVVDSANQIDEVYNYGMFDFRDPQFYTKYVRGTLRYFSAKENYQQFLFPYEMEGRKVVSQTLALDSAEVASVMDSLAVSIQEDRKYYYYDFLYKNCSSLSRDVIERGLHNKLTYARSDSAKRYIDILDRYLVNAPWSKLGIDLLLSSEVHRKVDARSAFFLPLGIEQGLDHMVYSGRNIVAQKNILIDQRASTDKVKIWNRPELYFALLLCMVIMIPATHHFFKYWMPLLMTILGLLGILFLFMWLGTNHLQTKHNLNLLWALPSHLFYLRFRALSAKYYRIFCLILAGISLPLIFIFQSLSLPILLLIAIYIVSIIKWRPHAS